MEFLKILTVSLPPIEILFFIYKFHKQQKCFFFKIIWRKLNWISFFQICINCKPIKRKCITSLIFHASGGWYLQICNAVCMYATFDTVLPEKKMKKKSNTLSTQNFSQKWIHCLKANMLLVRCGEQLRFCFAQLCIRSSTFFFFSEKKNFSSIENMNNSIFTRFPFNMEQNKIWTFCFTFAPLRWWKIKQCSCKYSRPIKFYVFLYIFETKRDSPLHFRKCDFSYSSYNRSWR